MSSLSLQPITIGEAREFIRLVHRHHAPRKTCDRFAVAVNDGQQVVGVAIVSNPTARMIGRDYTAEVSRLATTGHANACSMLYAAAWRAARALGYRRMITYILASEPGTSVAAAGWRLVAEVKGESWHRDRRPRVDRHPTQDKLRWEISA